MLNDLYKTYKKIIILVLLIVCSIFFWFFGFYRISDKPKVTQTFEKHPGERSEGYSYDFSSENLEGNVVFGTKGYLVPNKTLPVVMKVRAKDKRFAGTLKITLPGDDGNGISYQCALACSAGQTEVVENRIPSLGDASYFNLEILDTYGTTELSTTIVPRERERKIIEYSDDSVMTPLLVGILSNSYKEFETIKDMVIYPDTMEDTSVEYGGSIVKPIALRARDLEDPNFRFDALSIVIIDNFNTNILSLKARKKLRDYVEQQGGNLLIGTGANGKKVMSGISELAGAVYTGTRQIDMILPEAEGYDAGINLMQSKFSGIREGDWNTVRENDQDIYYGRSQGKGHILLSPISLCDKSILNWTDQGGLYSYYLENCINESDNQEPSEEISLWYMKSALYSFLSTSVPGTFKYGLFLLVYLAALGLFVYRMIRRKKRSEQLWIGIPILSLSFTLILALSNMGAPSVNSTLSAINVTDREKKVSEVYCLYQNLEGSGIDVPMNRSVVNVEPIDYTYRSDGSVTSDRSIKSSYLVNNTFNGYEIQFEDTVPGTSFMIKATAGTNQAMTDVPDTSETSSGKFDLSVVPGDASFSGIVINESGESYDAVILTNRNYYVVYKNVESGKAIQINEDDICEKVDAPDLGDYSDLEEDNTTLGNLINYVCQKYCSDDSWDQVTMITVNSRKNIKLFETENVIKNSYIVDVSRYPTEGE